MINTLYSHNNEIKVNDLSYSLGDLDQQLKYRLCSLVD